MSSPIKFNSITVENGLSANQVKCILKDNFGFMWFGTIEGLDRFDGYEIKSFTGKFPSGPQNINCLFQDKENNLWIGTERGLYRKEKGAVTISPILPDSLKSRITCIAELNSGEIGIGGDNGLTILNRNLSEMRMIQFSENIADSVNRITGMATDNKGITWITSLGGLIRLQKNSKIFELIRNTNHSLDNVFSSLAVTDNKVYLGTNSSGLFSYTPDNGSFAKIDGLNNDFIICLHLTGDGKLYIGTNGGGLNILDLNAGTVSALMHDSRYLSTLGSNSIYSIHSDMSGHLWIGTFSAGISHGKAISSEFKVFSINDDEQLANISIRSFCFPDDMTKLLGSREGFYHISDSPGQTSIQYFRSGHGNDCLRSNIILAVNKYKDKIMIGTYGGGISEYSLKDHRFSAFTDEPYFRKGFVYFFQEDPSGNLWIATLNGLYYYRSNNGTFDHFTTSNSALISNDVFSLLLEPGNRLWVGTMNGLNVFQINGDGIEPIDSLTGKSGNFKINSIFKDSYQRIWICTETGGLFRIDENSGKCVRFTDKDGLPGNSVSAVCENKAGTFWISTLKGLCRFTGSVFEKYTLSDGLPGLGFTPAAVHKGNDGKLWFGNEMGLVYFFPDSIKNASAQVPVQITDFFLFGNKIEPVSDGILEQPLETVREIRLKSNQNSIGFRFAALNFINAPDNRYEYFLEGQNDNWQQAGARNEVFFEKLKPGNYLFKVRLEGQSDEPGSVSQVKIKIRPLIFTHPLFLLAIIVLLVFAGYKLYLYFRKQSDVIHQFEKELKPHEKYEHVRVGDKQCQEVMARLKSYMEQDKPFLDGELKIADVASKIGIPTHIVSQVLNLRMNQNFTDFVNHYRIEEFKTRLRDADLSKFTLLAIAKDCGFNSKTSFHRIFKNETGFTPAEFLSDLKTNGSKL